MKDLRARCEVNPLAVFSSCRFLCASGSGDCAQLHPSASPGGAPSHFLRFLTPAVPAPSLPHQSSCPASITRGPTTVCLLSSPAWATLVSACSVALALTLRVAKCKPSPRPRPSRKRTAATHSPAVMSDVDLTLTPLTQPSCFIHFCFLTEISTFLNKTAGTLMGGTLVHT